MDNKKRATVSDYIDMEIKLDTQQMLIEELTKVPSVEEVCEAFKAHFVKRGFDTMKDVVYRRNHIVIVWESGGYSHVLDYSIQMIEKEAHLITLLGKFYEGNKIMKELD